MASEISAFGAFHTAVSVLPLGFGLAAFLRDGRIDPRNWLGRLYIWTTAIGSVTGLFIFHHGGVTPGHALSILTLALLLIGALANRGTWLGWAGRYVETISLSFSYLLLWIFTATETLTRLPVAQPIASGPDAPVLIAVQLGLLIAFLVGVGYQIVKLRGSKSF